MQIMLASPPLSCAAGVIASRYPLFALVSHDGSVINAPHAACQRSFSLSCIKALVIQFLQEHSNARQRQPARSESTAAPQVSSLLCMAMVLS